jgi:hypothetical protein
MDDLSVVVAAWPDTKGLSECLDCICSQVERPMQVIVVSLSAPNIEVANRFPFVQWLIAPAGSLIPHLWSLGIGRAVGSIVAITTTYFQPAKDWVSRITEAHSRLDVAGIGGRIAPPSGGGAANWATYFLRYSNYLKFNREQTVSEIAGENASYKRQSLLAHSAVWRDGFWEPEFHALLRADGKALAYVPGIVVTQGGSVDLEVFCRQRFAHGRRFGQSRVRNSPFFARLARILTSPLIPAALLGKIIWRVFRSGRHIREFLFCLPVLIVFVLAWTLGETWGYLTA